MRVDVEDITALREHHAAWGLLRYEHAPVVVAFLHRVFLAKNQRSVPMLALVSELEDELDAIRLIRGRDAMPRTAREYLDDWVSPGRAWLRRYFADGDEPLVDMTAEAEQAVAWVTQLTDRSFVGTESRLRTLLDLLDELALALETDADRRVADLERRRAEIDAEIEKVRRSGVEPVDERMVKERFKQFERLARELRGDFRQLDANFRGLDRTVRERVTGWEGSRGELVTEVLGELDVLASSDEGRSFAGFWELLSSPSLRDRLAENLATVLEQPAVRAEISDPRIAQIHWDWLEAGEHTQRTVALLSAQLRRFLDDAAWWENRRIMEILRSVEQRALALRDTPPPAAVIDLDGSAVHLGLPFERPLYRPRPTLVLHDVPADVEVGELDVSELFAADLVDVEALADHVAASLDRWGQVSLAELTAARPVEHGVAEIVTYLHLGHERFASVVDDSVTDMIPIRVGGVERTVSLNRVVFLV